MDWPKETRRVAYLQLNSMIKDVDPNLVEAIKLSDQFRNFLGNLSGEVSKAERLVHKRRGTPLKVETIRTLIKDMVKLFVHTYEKKADETKESLLARKKREEALSYRQDLENTVDGKPSGVFKELGIEWDEDMEASEGHGEKDRKTN